MEFHFSIQNADLEWRSRADVFLAENCGMSRNQVKQRLVSLAVNGCRSRLSRTLQPGDRVDAIFCRDAVSSAVVPEDIPLDIIFEDEDAVVVNKPQGMAVHPGAGHKRGTLANALLHHLENSDFAASFQSSERAGIVHRLDKDTSGAIICAKNAKAQEFLQSQFRERKVRKIYVALLCGVPNALEGELKNYIFRKPFDRKKFACGDNPDNGRFAHTMYRVVKIFESTGGKKYSLALFRIKTGRTHQIRVHAKFLSCPVLGDVIYGKTDAEFRDATLMLHAMKLQIAMPSGELRTFRAPVPERFRQVILGGILHPVDFEEKNGRERDF